MKYKIGDKILLFNDEIRTITNITTIDNKQAYGIGQSFMIHNNDGGWGRNYVFENEIKNKVEE